MLRALSGTTRLILLLLALLLSVIFLLPKQTRDVLQAMGKPVSALVFFPVEAFTSVEQTIIGVWQEYVALRHVREENRQLRRDLELLQKQNSDLRESASGAHRMAALLDFKEQFIPKTVAAQVIGRDSTNWYSSLILNKGDRDGVRPEMGVMGRDIAINVTREETRVAVLDNNQVTEVYVDRARHKDFVGNIYKGKVMKVLPGMQATFIDIGLDKAAFMHVSDLAIDTEPGETLVDTDDDDKGPEMPRPRRQVSKPIEELLHESKRRYHRFAQQNSDGRLDRH